MSLAGAYQDLMRLDDVSAGRAAASRRGEEELPARGDRGTCSSPRTAPGWPGTEALAAAVTRPSSPRGRAQHGRPGPIRSSRGPRRLGDVAGAAPPPAERCAWPRPAAAAGRRARPQDGTRRARPIRATTSRRASTRRGDRASRRAGRSGCRALARACSPSVREREQRDRAADWPKRTPRSSRIRQSAARVMFGSTIAEAALGSATRRER